MRKIETQELRERQLQILDAVVEFCKAHEIQCQIAYGTLLGAVRHQGYIPWDDDIDLLMLREEYEKLCDAFNENRTDTMHLYCLKNDPNFPFEYAKVVDTSTRLIEEVTNPYPNLGVNIDVFVADDIVNDGKLLRKSHRKVQCLRWVQAIKSRIITKDMAWWKRLIFYVAKSLLMPYSFPKSVKEIERLSKQFQNTGSEEYAAVVPFLHREYHPMKKEWLRENTMLPFEGKTYPASPHYHELLTLWYGDYMQLPPEEQRVTHHSFSVYALDEAE